MAIQSPTHHERCTAVERLVHDDVMPQLCQLLLVVRHALVSNDDRTLELANRLERRLRLAIVSLGGLPPD